MTARSKFTPFPGSWASISLGSGTIRGLLSVTVWQQRTSHHSWTCGAGEVKGIGLCVSWCEAIDVGTRSRDDFGLERVMILCEKATR